MYPDKFQILCVDDDVDTLDVIAEMVAGAGFEAIKVSDPTAVESTLRPLMSNVVLVLSDFRMPGLDGFDLRRQLAKTPAKEIPFAILSGHVDQAMALAAVDLGIVAFLRKPCRIDELTAVVKEKTSDRIESLRERRMLEESFFGESADLMEELEPLLLALEAQPKDTDGVASIFRLVHTIKGASGVLGREDLTRFLHAYEDALSQIKTGAWSATPAVISALLAAYDVLGRTLTGLRQRGGSLPDLAAAIAALGSVAETQRGDGGAEHSLGGGAAVGDAGQAVDRRESISVPKDMLDEFLHLTGETTVIRNMVNKLVRAIERRIPGDEDVELLVELLDEMHKINGVMQTKTAELRKTPISKALKKLPRTVRDVCAQLGKKAKLVVSGDTLRVDAAIVQALSNSLIHMMRNSVDHGIERPEERIALGKPAEGAIVLTCREVKDCVVVELMDDGGGIDPERIRTKLRDNGQLDPAAVQAMGREQLLRQIFEPGFSTAKAVTDVSGRGVGMDMVRTSIEELKGRIDINSEVGKGTTFKFTIPIPRSVVIINALIVGVADRFFAVPQDSIVRLLRITPEKRHADVADLPGGATLRVDGSLLPLVGLDEVLRLENRPAPSSEATELNVLVLRWDGGSYGLIVDAIHGAEDVVVKSLHSCVERIGAFAGSTFLDDGSVGLIIDVGGIAARAGHGERVEGRRDVDGAPAAEPHAASGVDLMLFELVGGQSFALPLECVFRIEELPRELIVKVGGRHVVRYRGELLPVLDLADALGLQDGPQPAAEELDKLGMLIVLVGERRFAVPIVRVVEVCRSESEVSPAPQATPGVRGLTTINHHVVTVIDLDAVARACGFALAANVEVLDEVPVKINASQLPAEPAAAAGWGLF